MIKTRDEGSLKSHACLGMFFIFLALFCFPPMLTLWSKQNEPLDADRRCDTADVDTCTSTDTHGRSACGSEV